MRARKKGIAPWHSPAYAALRVGKDAKYAGLRLHQPEEGTRKIAVSRNYPALYELLEKKRKGKRRRLRRELNSKEERGGGTAVKKELFWI